GDGVEQDETWCTYWYQQAAEQGHAAAQFILGDADASEFTPDDDFDDFNADEDVFDEDSDDDL
ncbi:MAG: hypothetical protein IIW01_00965, partial [Thermoguttaceae bacterium]|nr:hypothetical protein [Thermoguttaceae bacterium]